MRNLLTRTVVSACLVAAFAAAPARSQASCEDVAARRSLNIATINLLFSEIAERQQRLTRIADFAKAEADAGRPIDVFLLQEVVSGALVKTPLSSADLRVLLAERGLAYNHAFKLVNGIPFLLSAGNAALSRCAIARTSFSVLPIVTEEPFQGLRVPTPRVAMLAQISVPGAGAFNIYNTHLCAYCTAEERSAQARAALGFLRFNQTWWPGARAVFGGDLNVDLNENGADIYSSILGNGFLDSYREAAGPACTSLSCCTAATDPGCTYGVQGNPYVGNLFAAGPAARIDYIFLDDRLNVASAEVVFRTPAEGFVSDHSAVLATASW